MLKRSATGVHTDPDKVVYATTRTSENAFDPDTPTAVALKRRMFELLRIAEYEEDMADGLQLLRYRQKQAYIPHHERLRPRRRASCMCRRRASATRRPYSRMVRRGGDLLNCRGLRSRTASCSRFATPRG